MLAYQFSASLVAWNENTSFRINPILGSGDPNFFFIFHLVGLKEACMPNFSFLGFLEVVVLWLDTKKKKSWAEQSQIRDFL
jgi:hypothetical protein